MYVNLNRLKFLLENSTNYLFIFLADLQPSVPVLKEKFELLVKNQFLTRSLCVKHRGMNTVEEKTNEKPDFTLPNLNLAAIIKKVEGDNNSDPGDSKIYWKVNFDRLTQDLR